MRDLSADWPGIEQRVAAADRVLVMLDFDGTLSPIVERPEDAALSSETRAGLEALTALPDVTVAIVSGRAVSDVRSRVGLGNVIYIGNHGRERLDPGASELVAVRGGPEHLDDLRATLSETFADIPNVQIEDKGWTIAVHYRRVSEGREPEVENRAQALARRFAGVVRLTTGKKVFDYLPADETDKGSAVRQLLAQLGGIEAVVPIYCGDDTTDETAFQALPAEAITVYVGRTPKESAARYRVNDPNAVRDLVNRLVQVRRAHAPNERT